MIHRHKPERRTFLQDRLDILIKKQKTGRATFNELTELDEIVNADPIIRERIIRESLLMEEIDDFNEPSKDPEKVDNLFEHQVKRFSILNRIKSIIARIFNSHISSIKIGNFIFGTKLIVF
jgi:hypothetical protein